MSGRHFLHAPVLVDSSSIRRTLAQFSRDHNFASLFPNGPRLNRPQMDERKQANGKRRAQWFPKRFASLE